MLTYVHDPDSNVVDYGWEWEAWLAGDAISTATWVVPGDLTKTNEVIAGTQTVVWLSGGVLGQAYVVTCRLTTVGGRTKDKSFMLRVAHT